MSSLGLDKPNLALVGMPGCGKTTVGRLLAERLGWSFFDLDHEIERQAGMTLQAINEAEGFAGLRKREEALAVGLDCEGRVIATGGSIVYSTPAMCRLTEIASIVYLEGDVEELAERAGDLVRRGVIIRPGMTYADLHAERSPLYEAYADIAVGCTNTSPRATAEAVVAVLRGAMEQEP
ncbi:MAG: shikimate kinase [Planctomycetota bacterium]